jgi:exodeoxyribonuclease V gamma subunit
MLTIHRAERADRLVAALAAVLAEPLEDPLAAEVVAVPTRGIERWLTQRLSNVLGATPGRGDGVCANVDFPFPARLVSGVTAAAIGLDPDGDPWPSERSVWPLLDVVDEHLDEPWMATLAAHLGGRAAAADAPMRARRFAAVRHLAGLFDRYAVNRPTMIEDWAGGADTDGLGAPLPPDVAWQASLWRHLRERIGVASQAERRRVACDRLRDDPDVAALPPRLSLFGLTRLPAGHVDVLVALAAARDVHLFLLHPSAPLWERIRTLTLPDGQQPAPIRRRDDPTAAVPRNPLLATWGRDARELQLIVSRHSWAPPRPGAEPPAADIHHPTPAPADTLLRRLQADVRADAVPPGPPLPGEADRRPSLDPADGSLQVHACHGRSRQVEVLRDAILHLLADDSTLEPRDVIVMCPGIEAFAPLLQATFGAVEPAGVAGGEDGHEQPGDLPYLRVRLADRALRQTNPVLAAIDELLVLADGRITASQLVDFASRDPVRRRFRLDDDDLARVEEWITATGIRWGLDAAHRAPYQLAAVGENTWRAGLDRILLGVAVAEDELRLVGGVLPLDDVDSGDIDLAGRLAELVDRVGAAVDTLLRPQPIDAWIAAIAAAADDLLDTSEADAWQRTELDRLLGDISDEAGLAPTSADRHELVLPEVRALLADRLRGRPTRANFRTGHLTVCTLVPMRSVPHRVVCLLGLDDGVFPRRTAPDGDDVIERVPCVGDRDPRSEDRQLLLDALLAATEHVVITYSGRDERTNAPRPPAVPVGELLDVIDRSVRTADGAARRAVVVEHPLQSFDARNFVPGALAGHRPWSFDPVNLGGARALVGERREAPPFLGAPLGAVGTGLVELDDLVRFVQHPVRAFLRQRLGTSLSDVEEEPSDGLPVELDPLSRWQVGDRLLKHRLAGLDLDACIAAEQARGSLPPGTLGSEVLDDIVPIVEAILAELADASADGPAETREVSVDLGDGRTLAGTVRGVVGTLVRAASYSRVGPKHRLAAWVRLLALTAAQPDRSITAITVGRGQDAGAAGVARIRSVGGGEARDQLAELVDLHARGLREPLPIYCETSAAYAAAPPARRRRDATEKWETGQRWPREDSEPEHQLVLGGTVSFTELLGPVPRADEQGAGWAADETTRFGRYARRLWDGLLANEERYNL